MAKVKLTKTLVEGIRPEPDRENRRPEKGGKPTVSPTVFVWDSVLPGFGVKCTSTGGKTYVLQYRMPHAKSDRRLKIGRCDSLYIDDARDQARQLIKQIVAGIDPFEQREKDHKAREESKRLAVDHSFEAVADAFIEHYVASPRSRGAKQGKPRSPHTIRMAKSSVAFLKSHFAKQRIDQITAGDLRRAFDKIPSEQIATCKNIDASARILWRWAIEREYLQENPFRQIHSPATAASRNRVLLDDELALVWRATRKMSYPFAPIFRLLILTGQRREEVSAMDWSEVSKDEKLWKIPGTRTKNGVEQIVPLSTDVIAELQALAEKEEWPRAGLIFTVTGKTAVSGHSAAKKRLEATIAKMATEAGLGQIPAWRVHDFRRTVATGLQRLGIRLEVTEAVLNHTSGSRGGIAGVYSRHDWAEEKREALGRWADHVASLNRPKDISTPSKKAG